ncbi:hypothetical protein PPYR_11510 [Photinus pyralis]|uniref:Phosphatidic acid phosphatase type 2/haloperoxidase domain-containing protein n=1 Tax=Photinus pyralis TaxID=7054 RepID=A0A1Y1JV79_PHOPY|nr:sphingosine-1-phosphate phosphatase 2-like [Photinus pyralis]KAB0794671.1 hypothetical protein PPYR_11510 [Photinus pyralis]
MEVTEFLKQPHLVANIQQFFGIAVRNQNEFEIRNKFWYYFFLFGTALGDETFYTFFIPFWFWNIDGAVGRRVVLVWSIVMYIGQSIKDILRWERPGFPVVKLQSKWAMEYGMPSTHAMVAISLPFSVLLYTMDRYQYCVGIGTLIAVTWCLLVCVSRLYLGMHTVLDIVAGMVLTITLMLPLIPLVDKLDNYFLTNSTSPILVLVVSILMIVYYPNSEKWTPTRGDTTMVVSVCVGLLIGSWLNFQMGRMALPELRPPYTILWPSVAMVGYSLLRTFIGFLCVIIVRMTAKSLSYNFLCALLRQDVDLIRKSANSLDNKHKNFVELACKFVTCALIGFNTIFLIPYIFRLMRIERLTFYTEI